MSDAGFYVAGVQSAARARVSADRKGDRTHATVPAVAVLAAGTEGRGGSALPALVLAAFFDLGRLAVQAA
jgi:hypothetical protein